MKQNVTLDDAKGHRAVERYVEENGMRYLVVRPYGNAALVNAMARSSEVSVGNIAIVDDAERPSLRIHVKDVS